METGVEVHIQDSSTDDVTERGAPELLKAWSGIHYARSPAGLDWDRNQLAVLSAPRADYVWFVGDSLRILPGGVRRVLAGLTETPCDFAVVNMVKRGPVPLPAGLHRDPSLLLERIAWHMTLAGTTIYGRPHLQDLKERFGRYLGTDFAYLAIVFESLPSARRGLLWFDEAWLAPHPARKSAWMARTLDLWARAWSAFILSLPEAYPRDVKLRAIRAHSRHTGVLEWRSLERLRRKGFLDRELVRRYEADLRLASGVPLRAIEWLSQVPPWLAPPAAALGRLGAGIARLVAPGDAATPR